MVKTSSSVAEIIPEVLSASLVLAIDGISIPQVDLQKLLRSDTLVELLEGSVRIEQGVLADPERGMTTSYVVTGNRSQLGLVISPSRIEAHDRSGTMARTSEKLPQIVASISKHLLVDKYRAIGANLELSVRSPGSATAAAWIATQLLRESLPTVSKGVTITGLATRFFVTAGEIKTTMAVEPRWGDTETSDIWVSSNSEVQTEDEPDENCLRSFYEDSTQTVLGLLLSANLITASPT